MAEEQAPSDTDKTEDPTPRKKEKAEEKGQVAQSREVNHFFMISGLLIVVWFLGIPLGKSFFLLFKPWISEVAQRPADAYHILGNIREFFLRILVICSMFFFVFLLLALGAGELQTRFNFSIEHIRPQSSHLSFVQGAKRIFSWRGLIEFFKGVVKIILTGVVAYFVLKPTLFKVDALSGIQPIGVLQEVQYLVSQLLLTILLAMAGLAVVDYGYQWFQKLKALRMSRQEIKEEQKESYGDPTIKMRQRQQRRELAGKSGNLSQAIPEATVVITNPLHYAVALKWESKNMQAPVVVAKGTGFLAFRIRELARENFVPLVENPPLARLLHGSLEVGQEILPEHYKAVAQIIRYIMHLDEQKRAR